jgi:hypothetical protein
MKSVLAFAMLLLGPLPGYSAALDVPLQLTSLLLAEPTTAAPATRSRNVDGIMDNSFLVEEAYNQEVGVVQHIFTALYGLNLLHGQDEDRFDFSFTQEWPVFSQAHQFSYTLVGSVVETGGRSDGGFGDMLLNYRYQAYFDENTLTALAPRFSLILPTGDADDGFGNDTVGYQWALPFSTAIGDSWFVHANAGLTFLPDAGPGLRYDLLHYNLGASAIYALTREFHLMLEWVGFWRESPDAGGTSYDFESVISPGFRKAFNFSNGSQLVLGLALPVGLTGASADFGAFGYLSFEHNFMKSN